MTIRELDDQEREEVFALAEHLTGSCQAGSMRKEILASNVQRRMHQTGCTDLGTYLERVEADDQELQELVSALTIHTTSWFRESPHTDAVRRVAEEWAAAGHGGTFRVWCAACSTGEEPYSFAAVLEDVRQRCNGFAYEVLGSDIDPRSVEKARRAVYPDDGLAHVPVHLKRHFLRGSGRTEGLMVPARALRERCRFEVRDLRHARLRSPDETFHLIICRNVLIYFDPKGVESVVRGLVGALVPNQGHLVLGHSEPVDARAHGLVAAGTSVYRKVAPGGEKASDRRKVLVVDDSATIRGLLTMILKRAGNEVQLAEDAETATRALQQGEFDVITLDVNMPGRDGLTWLKEQRRSGLRTPVIVVSDAEPREAAAILAAMRDGTHAFVEKGDVSRQPTKLTELVDALAAPRSGAREPTTKRGFLTKVSMETPDLLAVGASTGGTEALLELLARMPSRAPPVLVVQHLSPAFAHAFAERLAQAAGLRLGAFDKNVPLEAGHLYMALDDRHLAVARRGGRLVLAPTEAPPLSGHRPSVDALFESCALVGARTFAALLTGMGRDGARGLKSLRLRGMMTCCQDEDSSVVFGMPREGIATGAAAFVGNLLEIRRVLDESLHARRTDVG